MARITNEQVTTACLAHYPEWSSFHQHEREDFHKAMRQTLQAYEDAKVAERTALASPATGSRQMSLIDFASGTSTPAIIVPAPDPVFVSRCSEVVAWQKTGILTGEYLREYAQQTWPNEEANLQLAESKVLRQACEFVVSITATQDEISTPSREISSDSQ